MTAGAGSAGGRAGGSGKELFGLAFTFALGLPAVAGFFFDDAEVDRFFFGCAMSVSFPVPYFERPNAGSFELR